MAVTGREGASRRRRGGAFSVGLIFVVVILSNCADRDRTATTSSPAPGYKIGKPYQINGLWYYPEVDYEYVETGIASWYGDDFHGKPTANGEIFDMNSVSAAHRTLPLPSIVRVTNLDNGRSLKMRVNDRGPFAKGRIIDVSRRSAQLLGFHREGTARVRVEIVADESRRLALGSGAPPQPPPPAAPAGNEGGDDVGAARDEIVALPLSAPPVATGQEAAVAQGSIVPIRAPSSSQIYVQAGAFSHFDNASRVRDRLSTLGTVQIHPFRVDGRSVYRVRLGPLSSSDEAGRLLAETVRAGYPGSQIILE